MCLASYCCADPWKASVTLLSQNNMGWKGPVKEDLWLDQVLGWPGLIKPFVFPKHQTAVSTAKPLLQPPAHQYQRPKTPGTPTPGHEMKDGRANH